MSTDQKVANEVGSRLKVLREMHGKSQEAWGELLGVKKHVVVDIERGKAKPSPELVACAVAKAGASAAWLAYGEGPMLDVSGDAVTQQAALKALHIVSLEVGGLAIPKTVMQLAQQWLFAVRLRRSGDLIKLYEQSENAAVNVDRLAAAIALFEQEIPSEIPTISVGKKANLIAAIYGLGASTNADAVRQLVRASLS